VTAAATPAEDYEPMWPAWSGVDPITEQLAAASDDELEHGADAAQTAYERTFLGWSDQPSN
jgi:hypothetical protein